MAQTPTILLIRPLPASERFLAALEERLGDRVPAVISPAMSIEPTDDPPVLDGEESLIFTSSNAVEVLRDIVPLQGRKALTVGERTAAVAASAGCDATCLGETVEVFIGNVDRISTTGRLLHMRGTHTRGDLAERLRQRGLTVDEQIVYDQRAHPPSRAASALLSGGAPVLLPLFSPRSARLVSSWSIGSVPLQVVAISEATRDAWPLDTPLTVSDTPDAEAMLTATERAFRDLCLGGVTPAH